MSRARIIQAAGSAVVTVITTALLYGAWQEWASLGDRVSHLEVEIENLSHAVDVYCDV